MEGVSMEMLLFAGVLVTAMLIIAFVAVLDTVERIATNREETEHSSATAVQTPPPTGEW